VKRPRYFFPVVVCWKPRKVIRTDHSIYICTYRGCGLGYFDLFALNERPFNFDLVKLKPHKSHVQDLSYKWSCSKVRGTFCSIIKSSTGKYCSTDSIRLATHRGFTNRLKSYKQLIQHNKEQHRK